MGERRLLVVLLRVTGLTMLCALVFVFCPFRWMAAIHQRLGIGQLNYSPLMSYLTRTLSAMYASFGAVFVFTSFDIVRYLPLVRFVGAVTILGGAGVTILDAIIKLPIFWTVSEGPFTILLGLAMVLLASRVNR